MPHISSQAAQFLTMPFRRHKQRYVINPPDEVHNVVYLGNVLTIIAKGEQSIERPLTAIWRSYTTRKRDVPMKLTVTRSGLKVETKQLGITEYWAHRITYCFAPPEYPRVFCWVYKHEGKRMKPELRCHAVLCKKQSEPSQIVATLTSYLQAALQEYKREKLTMEKARKNSITSGGCPRRKLILQTGTLNFRPPNRSKSAPRLGSIDEEDEMEGLTEENKIEDDGIEGTSMSDFEYDENSDLESLNYRQTPMLRDDHKYPIISTTFSLTDDHLSQASTSSNSTVSSVNPNELTNSKSFEDQPDADYESRISPENQEDEEIAETYFNNFPRRQLSLSSTSRKRLQPKRNLNISNDILDTQEQNTEVDKLALHIDATLVIEEDELVVESATSCASSDDGFGSSCHENDNNTEKTTKVSSQTTEFGFLSDDSANENDHQLLTKTQGVVGTEAIQIQRILMANQQVTAL